MIQVIALSTAIAFSVKALPVNESQLNERGLAVESDIECLSYEEVQGWEWENPECVQIWDEYRKREDIRCSGNACESVYIWPPACEAKKKILWRKLIGTCDDGTVRWVEEK